MTPLQSNLRDSVRLTLRLFQSSEAAQQFQANVPHVFAPTEILAKWFDDTYVQSEDFLGAFSPSELDALREFNAALERLAERAGTPPPPIEQFTALPEWNAATSKARHALSTIAA
jgi:hypothetical protein